MEKHERQDLFAHGFPAEAVQDEAGPVLFHRYRDGVDIQGSCLQELFHGKSHCFRSHVIEIAGQLQDSFPGPVTGTRLSVFRFFCSGSF